MTAIRHFQRVHNHKIELELPEQFEDQEVEVIVLPKEDLPDDLGHLEEAVRAGMEAEISPKSHQEVFQSLKTKYEN